MKAIIGVVLLLFFGGVLCADDLVFESGPKKVQLLELFTSEGCSSCPPAEASLGRLVNDPRLWHEFVPIAFHVDIGIDSAGKILLPLLNGQSDSAFMRLTGMLRAFTRRLLCWTEGNGAARLFLWWRR
jgi:hypothetical protein